MGARTIFDRLVEAGEEQAEKAPQRALSLPTLRPYVPSRQHLRRILGGLVVLVAMGWRTIGAGLDRATAQPKPKKPEGKPTAKKDEKGEKPAEPQALPKSTAADALERAGVAVLVLVGLGAAAAGAVRAVWPQIRPYATVLTSVALGGLLVAAWIVGPDKPRTKKPKAPGESQPLTDGGEAGAVPASLPQAVEPLTVEAVADAVRQLAVPRGWKGAHLDDLLAVLPGRSREELLDVLADAGIPVTEQLKLTLPGGRQRNRQGVRLTALPQAPAQPAAETPSEAPAAVPVEVAPEPAPRPVPVTVYGAE